MTEKDLQILGTGNVVILIVKYIKKWYHDLWYIALQYLYQL